MPAMSANSFDDSVEIPSFVEGFDRYVRYSNCTECNVLAFETSQSLYRSKSTVFCEQAESYEGRKWRYRLAKDYETP